MELLTGESSQVAAPKCKHRLNGLQQSALWVFSVLVWPVASEPPTRRPPALRGLELVRQAQLWWSVNDDKLRLRFRSGLLTTDIFIQRQFTGAIRGGSMPTNVLYNFIFDPLREELADNNHRNMWDYYRGSYTRFFHGENTGDIDFRVIVSFPPVLKCYPFYNFRRRAKARLSS